MIVVGALVTVIGGASGLKMMVPPSGPGPVPSAPAIKVRPIGRPRLWAGMVVPRVRVMAASICTSWPAHSAMLPSVVVMAWKTRTSRPAFSRTLPLTVVIGALTLISRPQQATRLPLVALIDALMFTSRVAFSVSVVGAPEAVQAMASLTWMSPLPGRLAPAPVRVLITTLVVTSWADRVAPEMLPPAPMVKSCGSISQVPVRPDRASVEIRTPSAMRTFPADVSMKPPSPPSGALASRTPPTLTVPLAMSASSRIVPSRAPTVRAWITPVLLTTVFSRAPAPWAVMMT